MGGFILKLLRFKPIKRKEPVAPGMVGARCLRECNNNNRLKIFGIGEKKPVEISIVGPNTPLCEYSHPKAATNLDQYHLNTTEMGGLN